jgi:hypothetical protein
VTARSGNAIAAEWLAALSEGGPVGEVRRALSARPTTPADAWRLLAAAEVVAAASGQPADALPESLATWIAQNDGDIAELIDLARQAVADATRHDSALHTLWTRGDAEDRAAWTLRLADLERRLGEP